MNTPTNLLDTWLAQEQEIRTRLDAGAGPGVARPDQVAHLTGMELMQAMLRGERLQCRPHGAIRGDAAGHHHWGPIAPCARVEVDLDQPGLRWSGQAYMDALVPMGSVRMAQCVEWRNAA